MLFLRRARTLACFVLVWFAATIGVATASPFVNPQSVQLVCSTAGDVKLLVMTDDGAQVQNGHALECPLCVHLGGGAPALFVQPAPLVLQPLALRAIPSAHIAERTAAPLPARGPPSFS